MLLTNSYYLFWLRLRIMNSTSNPRSGFIV